MSCENSLLGYQLALMQVVVKPTVLISFSLKNLSYKIQIFIFRITIINVDVIGEGRRQKIKYKI